MANYKPSEFTPEPVKQSSTEHDEYYSGFLKWLESRLDEGWIESLLKREQTVSEIATLISSARSSTSSNLNEGVSALADICNHFKELCAQAAFPNIDQHNQYELCEKEFRKRYAELKGGYVDKLKMHADIDYRDDASLHKIMRQAIEIYQAIISRRARRFDSEIILHNLGACDDLGEYRMGIVGEYDTGEGQFRFMLTGTDQYFTLRFHDGSYSEIRVGGDESHSLTFDQLRSIREIIFDEEADTSK